MCICYISSIFLYFHNRFWQHTLFLWQRNFYWFFQINSFCKIIFGSVSDYTSVELENSEKKWLKSEKWLSYLSHAISPYLHGKLINWTSTFYLSFYCKVLSTILNILIFMNRVISIFCICQLYFIFSYVILRRMVFVSILTTSRYTI